MNHASKTRYPGYDVLDKIDTPSWDNVTRAVIRERLSIPREPRFLDSIQWVAAKALADCVVVQPADRESVPVAAMLDAKLYEGQGDGYRDARLLPLRETWIIGLAALDAESEIAHGQPFACVNHPQQETLLKRMQVGDLHETAWQNIPPSLFFSARVLPDLYGAYYAHPFAWSEIGFGGPANPRGYVRLGRNARDAWEPVEVRANNEAKTREINRRVR
jgi:hypothetical protein